MFLFFVFLQSLVIPPAHFISKDSVAELLTHTHACAHIHTCIFSLLFQIAANGFQTCISFIIHIHMLTQRHIYITLCRTLKQPQDNAYIVSHKVYDLCSHSFFLSFFHFCSYSVTWSMQCPRGLREPCKNHYDLKIQTLSYKPVKLITDGSCIHFYIRTATAS